MFHFLTLGSFFSGKQSGSPTSQNEARDSAGAEGRASSKSAVEVASPLSAERSAGSGEPVTYSTKKMQ